MDCSKKYCQFDLNLIIIWNNFGIFQAAICSQIKTHRSKIKVFDHFSRLRDELFDFEETQFGIVEKQQFSVLDFNFSVLITPELLQILIFPDNHRKFVAFEMLSMNNFQVL